VFGDENFRRVVKLIPHSQRNGGYGAVSGLPEANSLGALPARSGQLLQGQIGLCPEASSVLTEQRDRGTSARKFSASFPWQKPKCVLPLFLRGSEPGRRQCVREQRRRGSIGLRRRSERKEPRHAFRTCRLSQQLGRNFFYFYRR
jgi:hypothetical protein